MKNVYRLEARNLSAGYDGKMVIEDISLAVPQGKISVLMGANACGKSTLLKTIARLIRPSRGELLLNGQPLNRMSSGQLARIMGLLPQSPVVPEGIRVADLVSRGRFPYHSFLRNLTRHDYQVVDQALADMGIEDIAERHVSELSGGQRQRVWIAMALAQETDILLLDEPTTFLDVSHQIEILDLLARLNREKGTTILMVLHEINLAARYADRLFALKEGRLIAEGSPEEIISPGLIRQVFDLDCRVLEDPVSGTPMIVPVGEHRNRSAQLAAGCLPM